MPAAAKSSAEMWDLLDEIETGLDNWEWGLRGDLEQGLSNEPRPYGSNALKAMRAFDSEALSLIPAVRKGCRGASKPALESLSAALRLGLLMGFSQTQPYLYHHDRYLYEIKPDVERGQKVRQGASLGGKERRDRARANPRRGWAIKRVLQLQAAFPQRTKHDICQQVGEELEVAVDGRTIRRWMNGVRWGAR